ncbi:UNVERIFIED_CONTAM: hypothetical protein NCL1_36840 [Trichonephila clavipes]
MFVLNNNNDNIWRHFLELMTSLDLAKLVVVIPRLNYPDLSDFKVPFTRVFSSLFFIPETQAKSKPGPDEIDNLIEEVIDLAWQINLEVDSDDVQELLDLHNQEFTIDKLTEMHEQETLKNLRL